MPRIESLHAHIFHVENNLSKHNKSLYENESDCSLDADKGQKAKP